LIADIKEQTNDAPRAYVPFRLAVKSKQAHMIVVQR